MDDLPNINLHCSDLILYANVNSHVELNNNQLEYFFIKISMDQDIIWFSQLCLTVEKYFVRFLKICILKHPNNGLELTHLYDKDKKVRFLPIFSSELHKIQQFYWVIGLINLSIDFLHKGLFINLFEQIDLKYHQLTNRTLTLDFRNQVLSVYPWT